MATLVVVAAVAVLVEYPSSQGSAQAYTVYTSAGRRTLPFRSSGSTDVASLNQISALFNLTIAEDSLVGGLTVRGRGQTVLLIPGQSFASIGPGRIVSLPAPIQRERNEWQVPVDFIRLVIAPALGTRVEIRRPSRIILVGDIRLPTITGRFERLGSNGRLTFQVDPATPHRVTREGRRVTVRFDAVALEMAPVGGLVPALVASVRVDGASILVDLGPDAVNFRATDPDSTRIALDLMVQEAPPPPPPPAAPPPTIVPSPTRPLLPPPPVIDTGAGTLRTIVIDPGHGGDDAGATGKGGTKEKDLALQLARRLKAAIENKIGLRVLLTRDNDENIPADRRTALANNNKADLFISLHANASVRPETSGAQVLSLRLEDYENRRGASPASDPPVPVAGGGTRVIDVVHWDLAQIPHAARSANVAGVLARHLGNKSVPLYSRPTALVPLRPLVGANMPAVLLEVGFLTNEDEEKALGEAERSNAILDAIVDTITELRRGIPIPPPPATP